MNKTRRLKARPALRRAALTLAVTLAALALARITLALLPFPELRAFRERSYGVVLTDRDGAALRALPAEDGVKREWADLDDIPAAVVSVFVRAEDRRFYLHPGVDPVAVVRSALRNARAGRVVSGASTITMQLARLVKPRAGGFAGKIAEAVDALKIEARLSKRGILELYLNSIPFGSNIEGLPAMARARFGLAVSALDAARACLLAVIPRRPGLYDPIHQAPGAGGGAAAAAALELAARCGLDIGGEDIEKAAREAAVFSRTEAASPFHAPHFTERAAAALPSSPRSPTRTTLSLPLQRQAEALLRAELDQLAGNRVSNGAILAIENATGAARVYVGSASWFDDEAAGKIDGARIRAQPGSCLKPFLYALAIDRGFTPAAILPDIPTVFGTSEAYIPSNFNSRFNGPVRLRVALASSLNVPAVYTIERVGVSAFEDFLVSLGFDSIAETRGTRGTGLALGNAEVSLEELVRAFAAFPRGGAPAALRWFEDAPAPPPSPPVMSAYAAWAVADMLSDKASRFVGFGPANALDTPFTAMFKTGTANQYQHIWALGASRRFTVGVWMGNFSGETVVGRTGSSIPARIASRVLQALEAAPGSPDAGSPDAGSPDESPAGPPPPRTVPVSLCALSGLLAGPYCPGAVTEYLPSSGVPGQCSWHTAAGLFYPPEYRAWLAERFRQGASWDGGGGAIRAPVSGAVFYLDGGLPADAQALRVETTGFDAGALVYLDGALQGGLNHAGVYALPLTRGRHRLAVEDALDGAPGRRASVDFEVR